MKTNSTPLHLLLLLLALSLTGILRSQPTNKYPYETVDDDGITKVVVMTVEQADAINKKFRNLEGTISQQKIIIEKQIDTITRYEQKVVFVEVTNTQALAAQKAISDSLQLALDTMTTAYSDLNKLLYEMAVGPTLLYTIPPYDEIMFLDLKYYNLYNDADGQLCSLVCQNLIMEVGWRPAVFLVAC